MKEKIYHHDHKSPILGKTETCNCHLFRKPTTSIPVSNI